LGDFVGGQGKMMCFIGVILLKKEMKIHIQCMLQQSGDVKELV